MVDLTGKYIGRYHIVEQLGQGGMATVYRAFDTNLERDVALKVIRTDMIGSAMLDQMRKRFEREARSLAKMEHPNIVHVHDYGEHEGAPYLVMQYLPGGTLNQLSLPLPYDRAARMLLPVARALDYAHQRGVVHRDVKPANILITAGGVPMLSDFGIAKMLGSEQATQLTGTGVGIGTPEYMAPEQWTGQAAPGTDIYALGIVFFEMVTGIKPFTADTPAAILLKQANDPLPRPQSINPQLPDTVEKVLFKALAKRPADRYAAMSEFADALEALSAAGGQPAPPPVPAGETLPRPQTAPPPRKPQTPPPAAPAAKPKPTAPPAPAKPWWKRWYTWLGAAALALTLVCLALAATSGLLRGLVSPTAPDSMVTVVPAATPQDGNTAGMALVPAGPFEMGSEAFDDSQPVHTVYLDAFWIDRTQVTNADFAVFLNAVGNHSDGTTWLDAGSEDARIHLRGGTWTADPGYEDHPVVQVNWFGAQVYCTWMSKRLPTEAEWEKAARGTDGRTYPWGDEFDCTKGNFDDTLEDDTDLIAAGEGCDGFEGTAPVGSFASGASPYGVLDMAGNAWDWLADRYQDSYYRKSPERNPPGPSSGETRVLRGGAWRNIELGANSAFRREDMPYYSSDYYSFRCALSAMP